VHLDGEIRINGREVMDRVKRERDRFVGRVLGRAASIPSEDKLSGYARFVDTTVLEVGDNTMVRARTVVIATGSSPVIPLAFEVFGDRLVVNDDVFDWEDLPRRVAVFGPGVIGLELGQALSRLGVHVRIFGVLGAVGPLTDPAIVENVTSCLREELYLDPDVAVSEMKRDGDEAVITYTDLEGNTVTERFDYVLAATGRSANVGKLGLECTGLQLDKQGVPVFDRKTLQCGCSPVFIAGDANNILPLLHEASDEGKAAGANAATYPAVCALSRRAPLSIVFSDPQIAMVGQRYADLEPGTFVTGTMDFVDQGRSRVMLKNRGLMRVYADKQSGRFIGAEWAGPRAENIAHLLAWAYQQSLTIEQMLKMPFYHPVVEEGLGNALQNAMEHLRV
jgi:dihydrolipoamide dehydrogenase